MLEENHYEGYLSGN